MTNRSPMALGIVALLLTACAMALGGPPAGPSGPAAGRAAPLAVPPAPPALACALEARRTGGGVALSGRVTAAEALSGTYALRVRGGGTAIDQGGPFALPAGGTATLGQASLPGRAADYELSLTVEAGGQTTACPVESD